MREKRQTLTFRFYNTDNIVQSHIQHYVEPAAPAPNPTANTSSPLSTPALPSISSVYGSGPLLPLGQGTLTHNLAGLPIMVVCTKADFMDLAGDEAGMKGAAWEEKTDWVQQVLRTVCLSCKLSSLSSGHQANESDGASLFYTATTQPDTYSTLTQYLLHQLYTTPPPLNPTTDAPPPAVPTRFPFPYRANVLDGDAVRIPAGWDSWGKISVLREGFDPARVGRAWDTSLTRMKEGEGVDGEGVEELWEVAIPIPDRGPKVS
jgi:dynein light intermediate chain 1